MAKNSSKNEATGGVFAERITIEAMPVPGEGVDGQPKQVWITIQGTDDKQRAAEFTIGMSLETLESAYTQLRPYIRAAEQRIA